MSALFLLFVVTFIAAVLFVGVVFGSDPNAYFEETPDEDPRGTEVPPTDNAPDREGVYYNPEDDE